MNFRRGRLRSVLGSRLELGLSVDLIHLTESENGAAADDETTQERQ